LTKRKIGGWATSEAIQEFFERKYKDKLKRLHKIFDTNGVTPEKVSVSQFFTSLQKYDRYITDRDVKQMLIRMGYKNKSDAIDVNRFFSFVSFIFINFILLNSYILFFLFKIRILYIRNY